MKTAYSNANQPKAARPNHNKRRWHTFNRFLDDIARSLPNSAALIWLLLFRHADNRGEVTLGTAHITKTLGIGRRTVSRGLAQLREAGLLKVLKAGNPNQGISTYKITVKVLNSIK